jgi:hypothetical protein
MQEAEIEKIMFQASPCKEVHETESQRKEPGIMACACHFRLLQEA